MAANDDDFYQLLRRKIHGFVQRQGASFKYSEFLLAGPDLFHLLCRLALDARVPVASKALLATAIAYFISPVDLLPEGLLGPGGYLDDIALAAMTIHRLINSGSGEVAREHWAGDGDLLEITQRILDLTDKMLGAQALSKLRQMFA